MGEISLGEMMITNYPPALKMPFKTADPPLKNGNCNVKSFDYFNQYRNENLSKFQMFSYNWGFIEPCYIPKPKYSSASIKNMYKYIHFSKPLFTMLDPGRMSEIDDFYLVAQMHRDQMKDYTGNLHPLKEFKKGNYLYACPENPTTTYFKFPQYYTKYRDPIVLPITLERTQRSPLLPDRALTGRYGPHSDTYYKN